MHRWLPQTREQMVQGRAVIPTISDTDGSAGWPGRGHRFGSHSSPADRCHPQVMRSRVASAKCGSPPAWELLAEPRQVLDERWTPWTDRPAGAAMLTW